MSMDASGAKVKLQWCLLWQESDTQCGGGVGVGESQGQDVLSGEASLFTT